MDESPNERAWPIIRGGDAIMCIGLLDLVHFPLPCFLAHAAFIFFISGFSLICLPGHWFFLSKSQRPRLSRSTGIRFSTEGGIVARAGLSANQ